MSKFLLRRKYFQRHSQLLNSFATYSIAFTFKAIMEDGEIVDRKSAVKTLPSHFLLFDRDQNCFCIENLKLIFWKTGKRVKNILIDLSPFSCLAPEPTLSEHSSHTFTTLPMVKPFCPWSTFVWWVLNTKPAIFTQHLQGREINNLPRYRKYFVSSATFHAHFREDTSDFFSFLLDCCTRCPDSTGALNWLIARCWCSRFLFSLFAGFIFSSCWSFCLPFLWCCQPRLFDF